MQKKKRLTAEEKQHLRETRYVRQTATFIEKHGEQAYSKIGSLGGKKSPTKFNSETARLAARKSWENRRAREAAGDKNNGRENSVKEDHSS